MTGPAPEEAVFEVIDEVRRDGKLFGRKQNQDNKVIWTFSGKELSFGLGKISKVALGQSGAVTRESASGITLLCTYVAEVQPLSRVTTIYWHCQGQ